MDFNSRIYVTHHHDMIGGSIAEALRRQGYKDILLKTDEELDLTCENDVLRFFEAERPEYVFCFAGPHGGIIRNVTYPADLCYTNLKIQCAVINSAYKTGVKKLLFMTGNCAYPKNCTQPITEDSFMDGKMEPTNAAYSTARAAGIELCLAYNRQYGTSFIPAILTNYFGKGDDFSENGHVLASVMKKMHDAKIKGENLTLWGDGTPKRQFMFMDDMAEAAILIMNKFEKKEIINIAGGTEFSIKELAEALRELTGYTGEIIFDSEKPNGAMRKLLDNSKLKGLGYSERVSFAGGLEQVYEDFMRRYGNE